MFGIDSSELFVIGLVALLVIGPQRLPHAMRMVGQWVAKGRAMTRHVRSGFDAMMREAELEELQKAWAKQNEAIIKATEMDPTAFMDPGNPQITSQLGGQMTALPEPEMNLTVPLADPPTEPQLVAGPAPEKPVRKRKPRAKKAQEIEPDER